MAVAVKKDIQGVGEGGVGADQLQEQFTKWSGAKGMDALDPPLKPQVGDNHFGGLAKKDEAVRVVLRRPGCYIWSDTFFEDPLRPAPGSIHRGGALLCRGHAAAPVSEVHVRRPASIKA